MCFEVKSPGGTVYAKALKSFQRKAHSFSHSSPSSEKAVIRQGSETTYTLFSQSEIVFEQNNALPTKPHSRALLARTSSTSQGNRHIFEFSRPLKNDKLSTDGIRLEASQFEVYLCIYNETNDDIPWFVHSITAGDR